MALVALLAVGPLTASAAPAGALAFRLEPIIGYERVQKLVPTVHSKDRLLYGARLSWGLPTLAAEVEIIRGTDTEDFPLSSLTVKDLDDRVKMGVKLGFAAGSRFQLTVRGGAQARRNVHEEILSGVSTKVTKPTTYKPYVGLGFGVTLGPNTQFNIDATGVFTQFPQISQSDVQVTAGFAISIN